MKDNESLELEFTYLVKQLPDDINAIKPIHMLDVYLPDTDIHPHLRLRKKDGKYEITKKQPISEGDASIQLEQTIPLSVAEFESLKNCSVKTVEKNRYVFYKYGAKVELDIFLGKLKGLALVDFEFEKLKDRELFKVPEFALADVTQEDFVAGGMLAGKAYSDIEKQLERFNYRKINF